MRMTRRIGRMGLLAALFALAPGANREARAGLVYFSTTTNGVSGTITFGTVNTTTGAINVISNSTPLMVGLEFVNGQLYGEGANTNTLYQINAATGTTTSIGTFSANLSSYATAFSANANGLTYGVNGDGGPVYTLTPPSTTLTATNLNTVIGNDRLFAVGPDGNIDAVVGTTLYFLNTTTNVLATGPTLTQSFDLNSRANLFFDGSTLDVLAQGGLYTINTTTGAVTKDYTLGLSQVFAAAEMPSPSAVPEPSSLALCGIGGAALALAGRWRRRRLASPPRVLV